METARRRVRLFNDYARFLLMTTNVTTMIAISSATSSLQKTTSRPKRKQTRWQSASAQAWAARQCLWQSSWVRWSAFRENAHNR